MTNREQLERLYEEWGRGDLSRDDIFDPEVVSGNYGIAVETPELVMRGLDEVRRGMADWLAAFQLPLVLVADEIHESGDRFLVLLRWRGHGKESGVPIDAEGAHLWEFRDGRAIRFDVYRDRAYARQVFEG